MSLYCTLKGCDGRFSQSPAPVICTLNNLHVYVNTDISILTLGIDIHTHRTELHEVSCHTGGTNEVLEQKYRCQTQAVLIFTSFPRPWISRQAVNCLATVGLMGLLFSFNYSKGISLHENTHPISTLNRKLILQVLGAMKLYACVYFYNKHMQWNRTTHWHNNYRAFPKSLQTVILPKL